MEKVAKQLSKYLGHKIVIIITGLILSVVLHELFHIWMHWGDITSISFFQGGSIAEMIVLEHRDNDIEGEELAAYLITLLVILLTIITVYKINDSTDTRTTQQIIFGSDKDAPKLKSSEFFKLADKADLLPAESKKPTKKKRDTIK